MKREISNSPWQSERQRKLQRACVAVQARVERGEPARRALRAVAGRMGLNGLTLKGHFYKWKRGGQLAAVFQVKYRGKESVFTSWMLIRFLNFILRCPQPSLKAALKAFTSNGRGFRTRPGRPLVPVSYAQLRYHFGEKNFALVREQQTAIERALATLAGLKAGITAGIVTRFPERRQNTKGLIFEI